MAIQDIARSIVNRTGEFGGNVQELAKNILDKRQQRQEFFNQNPEAQKVVNRMKPPMQRAVEFVGKNYLYNPETKKPFPASPIHTIQDMVNIQQQWKSGELSEKEARKQLSQKAVNMAMVMGELSPSPKAVNNQAARALKMLEEQAKKFDSADEFVNSVTFRDAHTAPGVDKRTFSEKMETGGEFNLMEVVKGKHNQPSDYFDSNLGPRYYGHDNQSGMESLTAINNIKRAYKSGNLKDKTVTAYRTIPNKVDQKSLQDGDWISFSKTYAEDHGLARFGEGNYKIIEQEVSPQNVWWDGNDIREWGFDTGKTKQFSRAELNAIYNQATQPQLSDDLIKEAQKYKSAEEFVRDQEVVYHGGEIDDLNKYKVGYGEAGVDRQTTNPLGIYFSDNEKVASEYGSKKIEAILPKNSKILDLTEAKTVGDLWEKIGYKPSFVSPYSTQPDYLLKDMSGGYQMLEDTLHSNPGLLDKIKSEGYSGIKFREMKGDNWFNTTVVFDPKSLLSKSQLTDIWNKAMSKVKGK